MSKSWMHEELQNQLEKAFDFYASHKHDDIRRMYAQEVRLVTNGIADFYYSETTVDDDNKHSTEESIFEVKVSKQDLWYGCSPNFFKDTWNWLVVPIELLEEGKRYVKGTNYGLLIGSDFGFLMIQAPRLSHIERMEFKNEVILNQYVHERPDYMFNMFLTRGCNDIFYIGLTGMHKPKRKVIKQ